MGPGFTGLQAGPLGLDQTMGQQCLAAMQAPVTIALHDIPLPSIEDDVDVEMTDDQQKKRKRALSDGTEALTKGPWRV